MTGLLLASFLSSPPLLYVPFSLSFLSPPPSISPFSSLHLPLYFTPWQLYSHVHIYYKFTEYELLHVDEFIDELLRDDRVCDIILPRIQKRATLEQNEELEPRVSALDEDLSDVESDEEEEPESDHERDRNNRRSSSPSHRHYDRNRERHRSRSRSPGHRRLING